MQVFGQKDQTVTASYLVTKDICCCEAKKRGPIFWIYSISKKPVKLLTIKLLASYGIQLP